MKVNRVVLAAALLSSQTQAFSPITGTKRSSRSGGRIETGKCEQHYRKHHSFVYTADNHLFSLLSHIIHHQSNICLIYTHQPDS